jgi:hypothetical protein
LNAEEEEGVKQSSLSTRVKGEFLNPYSPIYGTIVFPYSMKSRLGFYNTLNVDDD